MDAGVGAMRPPSRLRQAVTHGLTCIVGGAFGRSAVLPLQPLSLTSIRTGAARRVC